jgi:hypothetical protein
MEITIQAFFSHFRQKIDSVLDAMHDEHLQKGLVPIRKDTEPISLRDLHLQVDLQLEEIRRREEKAAAIMEQYQLDMQQRVRNRNAQLLHDSTQRAMQSALANVLEKPTPTQPQPTNIADVPTVCLNDVVARSFTPRTPTQPMSALEYIEQGGLEETQPRQKALTPPLPTEWSPLRQREPLPEEIQQPQELRGIHLHDCNQRQGESAYACFERCLDEYIGKYATLPEHVFVSPSDNTTLTFYKLSFLPRESASLQDGHMIAEG